ncbi:MAG: hypothetical protein JWR06_1463 [Jatrophihabitans sp.]|nr:hypothetical protein [Jatrophihabitans sp.]
MRPLVSTARPSTSLMSKSPRTTSGPSGYIVTVTADVGSRSSMMLNYPVPLPYYPAPNHGDPTGQALIVCRSSPLLVTEILRGLAFSATGMFRVSTPAA